MTGFSAKRMKGQGGAGAGKRKPMKTARLGKSKRNTMAKR